ncbi:MAG: P-II family nitrogen regulator [Phycisphaerae bacterium]|jgi:nitrogen regulatory protein P-II 1
MKKIEAIIRPAKVQDVCSALDKLGHAGMMITEIEGHGRQKGMEQQFRGKTYKVSFLTKVRIQVIADDQDVDKITQAICQAAFTGKVGDGKIFIYPVDDVVRIRTGERAQAAL